MPRPNESGAGFYFALPRLVAGWPRGPVARSERSSGEAHFMALLMFAISYGFVAHLFTLTLFSWRTAALLLPLALLVLLGWIALLLVNSIVAKRLHASGWFTRVPLRQIQSVLIAGWLTFFSCELIRANSTWSCLGLFWCTLLVLNLIAAGLIAARR